MDINVDIDCDECHRSIRDESDVVCRACYDGTDQHIDVSEWLQMLRDYANRRPDLSVEGLIDNWRWENAPLVAHKQQTDPVYAKMIEIQAKDAQERADYIKHYRGRAVKT